MKRKKKSTLSVFKYSSIQTSCRRCFKILKDLFQNLKSRSSLEWRFLKSFEFSTFYTTLPHDNWNLVWKDLCVIFFPWFEKQNMLFLVTNLHFSLKRHRSAKCATKKSSFSLITYFIFGLAIFQQQVSIPMGTNRVPLLVIFLYS